MIEVGGTADSIVFAAGIAPATITVARSGNDLRFTVGGNGDQIVVRDDFVGAASQIESVHFADGTVWDSATLQIMATSTVGTAGDDALAGTGADDKIYGLGGNDTMAGGAGDDTYVVTVTADVTTEAAGAGTDAVMASLTWTLGSNLENLTLTGTAAINGTGNTLDNVIIGNSGVNTLSGGAGNDTLDGAAGNDALNGAAGADTYRFGRGWGTDTITDNDATANVIDKVEFGAGIVQTDLSFTRLGNDLNVAVAGGTDRLVVKDWYLGAANHVEHFRFVDGSTLTDVQAQSRVLAVPGGVGALAAGDVMLVGLAGHQHSDAGWPEAGFL